MKQFIGKKKITSVKESETKTDSGVDILVVSYDDGTIEHFSKLMFDKIVSQSPCEETELREKRISEIVSVILTVLRDWGIKTGELPYLSALLNKSLDYNQNQAMIKLVSEWMPEPNSLDDIDLITIDRILKSNGDPSKN